MAGLLQIGNGRPVFDPAGKTLTFTTPSNVLPGDLLLLVFAYDPGDSYTLPAGWVLVEALTGAVNFDVLGRDVVQGDSTTTVLSLVSATKEWQGQIIALRGGSPAVVLETFAVSSFGSVTPADAPATSSRQAINLELVAWSWTGATLPLGINALLDRYTTNLVSTRCFTIAMAIAGATGTLPAIPAANGATTFLGTAISLVLRDRVPVVPLVLFDPVPGNIGLQGLDTRGLPEQVNLG